MTETAIRRNRRDSATVALNHFVAAAEGGYSAQAQHWMSEARRLLAQPLTTDADLSLHPPAAAAIGVIRGEFAHNHEDAR